MNLFDKENKLVITFMDGIQYNISYLIKAKGGVVFVELFPSDATGRFPLHYVKGVVKKINDTTWNIGENAIITKLQENMKGVIVFDDDSENYDKIFSDKNPFALFKERNSWDEYLKTKEGEEKESFEKALGVAKDCFFDLV